MAKTTAPKAKTAPKEIKKYSEEDIKAGFKFKNKAKKELEVISFEREKKIVTLKGNSNGGSYIDTIGMAKLLECLNNGLLTEIKN